jgi:hypothetical protein
MLWSAFNFFVILKVALNSSIKTIASVAWPQYVVVAPKTEKCDIH